MCRRVLLAGGFWCEIYQIPERCVIVALTVLGPGSLRQQASWQYRRRREGRIPLWGRFCPRLGGKVMTDAVSRPQTPKATRWIQLVVGIICMSMIANLQYGWTLFVAPIDAKFGWGRPAIQLAFTIFVLTETWLVPVEGWFVDRFGPRIVVVIGGVLCGISWMMNSVIDSLFLLYIS